ncbi:MAG: hypothetical protein QOI40_5771 [Alphaproteobacteria bacterium]|nr:hypothetical protein [Alphaproteobacteria bacterium]
MSLSFSRTIISIESPSKSGEEHRPHPFDAVVLRRYDERTGVAEVALLSLEKTAPYSPDAPGAREALLIHIKALECEAH